MYGTFKVHKAHLEPHHIVIRLHSGDKRVDARARTLKFDGRQRSDPEV